MLPRRPVPPRVPTPFLAASGVLPPFSGPYSLSPGARHAPAPSPGMSLFGFRGPRQAGHRGRPSFGTKRRDQRPERGPFKDDQSARCLKIQQYLVGHRPVRGADALSRSEIEPVERPFETLRAATHRRERKDRDPRAPADREPHGPAGGRERDRILGAEQRHPLFRPGQHGVEDGERMIDPRAGKPDAEVKRSLGGIEALLEIGGVLLGKLDDPHAVGLETRHFSDRIHVADHRLRHVAERGQACRPAIGRDQRAAMGQRFVQHGAIEHATADKHDGPVEDQGEIVHPDTMCGGSATGQPQ